MSSKIFVGNLPWGITSRVLSALLDELGHPHQTVKVVEDHDTGKSRGFAFVEFESPEQSRAAIQYLDGYVLDGRTLRSSEASYKPRGGGGRERGGGSRDRGGGHSRRDPRVGGESGNYDWDDV